MEKKSKIILPIFLIITGISVFIFNTNLLENKFKQTPLKIEILSYDNDLLERLGEINKQIPLELNKSDAQIKFSWQENQWPNDWQTETIYTERLNLEPETLGKFFQGDIPTSKANLYLAYELKMAHNNLNFKQEIVKLTNLIKKSYENNPPQKWTLTAVGDIMLSRHVDEKIENNGVDWLFEKTNDLLKDSDLTFANLESPFKEGDSPKEGMVFGAEKENVSGLKNAGFDILSLANNHFGNQGQKGAKLTIDWLAQNGLEHIGAGKDFNEAHKPLIKEIKGQKIAFLGYTDTDVIPESYIADADWAGIAAMDSKVLENDILKIRDTVDLIIISMHSGTEYTPHPNKRQKEFARNAIDFGADLVIGHHPHVVQAVEFYKGKFIAYSLGNFIFDQYWSEETQQGLIAKFEFTGNKLTGTELTPVHLNNSQPSIITSGPEYEEILSRVYTASEKLFK